MVGALVKIVLPHRKKKYGSKKIMGEGGTRNTALYFIRLPKIFGRLTMYIERRVALPQQVYWNLNGRASRSSRGVPKDN